MSETNDPAVPAEAPAPAPDAPVPETPITPPPAPDPPPAAEPEATPEPEPAAKPKANQGDRRFAIVTAKMAAQKAELEAAQRRAEAAESLLNAGKPEAERQQSPRPQEDTERRAQQIVAEREFAQRRGALIAEGTKELGIEAWNAKTDVLQQLGATESPAFMEALVGLPGAAKLVAHLADDADALVALLGKSPVAMAAEMGRMVAEIQRPATKPLSSAPRPVTPISTPAVVPPWDPSDETTPMNVWVAEREKELDARRRQRRGAR